MQTKPTTKPAGSPISGIIPEPVAVHHDTVPTRRRVAVTSTARGTTRSTPAPGRRDPAGILAAKVLGVLRSGKRTGASSSKNR